MQSAVVGGVRKLTLLASFASGIGPTPAPDAATPPPAVRSVAASSPVPETRPVMRRVKAIICGDVPLNRRSALSPRRNPVDVPRPHGRSVRMSCAGSPATFPDGYVLANGTRLHEHTP